MVPSKIKINTISHENIRYISVQGLISYLDENAMMFEKNKDTRAVEVLNNLADLLSKIS